MYKVFLVDDEIVIREGIRNSFPWDDGVYTLVGEAPDGEIALPMIRDESPDILVTDIRMPFMDGMALCREVRRLMPWMEIIILSGYDDFDYARQAMSMGVQEYLLKPITARELRDVLDRVARRIDDERRTREDIARMRRRFASGNRFVKEKLLSGVLADSAGNAQATLEQLRSLGMNLAAQCYAVAEIAFETEDEESHSGAVDALYQLAEASGGIVHVCASKHGAFALVLGDTESDTEERVYSFAQSAITELDRLHLGGILASIGETVFDFSQLAHSAQSARHIRHVIAARGQGKLRIVGVRELGDAPAVTVLDIRPLYERLQYAAVEEIDAILTEYATSLGATEIHSSVAADYLHVETLMTASRIVREAGGDPHTELETEHYEPLTAADIEDALPAAGLLLRRALSYRDERSPSHGNPSVSRARSYLAQHFSDPNLMLNDVSQYVCMSNSRFSTVFAQETGITFTEYLTALRIGKACELLRATAMRSSQIAAAVGYNDPHYFSYLFKKRTGLTPSDYRKENPTESQSD